MMHAAGTGSAWTGVVEELLRPREGCSGAGAWLETGSVRKWLRRPPACPCAEADGATPDPAHCAACGRTLQHLPLGEGQALVLCTPDAELAGLAAILHDAAGRIAELEEARDGLCEELALSYESLASIYEVGTDPSLLLDSGRALDRILERLEALRPGIQAVFWLRDGTVLRPVRWCGEKRPAPASVSGGLLGRCLALHRGLIFNLPDPAVEPETVEGPFRGGGSVAVAPLQTRDQVIGCLSVREETSGAFDSHLMGLLTALGNQAAMVLEHERLYREMLEGERMRSELVIGARIQRSLLFGRVPDGLDRLDIGVVTEPSRHVDGDFFEFFPRGSHCLDLLVGDVMGKGLPAALVGAAVKSEFLRMSGGGRDGQAPQDTGFPARVVALAHQALGAGLADLGTFVTACYARLDLAEERLHFVDCGHTSTLHYRAAEDRVVELEDDPEGCVNLPLGMDPSCGFRAAAAPLAPGDVLLFYSDGVTEARNADGAMYGSGALVRFLHEHQSMGAADLAEAVRRTVTEFTGSVGLSDDLTCVVVKVLPESEPAGEVLRRLEIPARRGELHQVRAFVAAVCAGLEGLDDEVEHFRLQLALVEAVSNVVRHAYPAGSDGKVRLEARRTADSLRFTVADRGRHFDPEAIPAPAFDGSRSGGFGIFLIREVMDEVHYSRGPDGTNRLLLVKRLDSSKRQ